MDKRLEYILKFAVGIGVLFAFLYVIASIINNPKLEDNTLVAHVLGIIEGFVGALIFYWWGTSESSQKKTEADNEQKKKTLK